MFRFLEISPLVEVIAMLLILSGELVDGFRVLPTGNVEKWRTCNIFEFKDKRPQRKGGLRSTMKSHSPFASS